MLTYLMFCCCYSIRQQYVIIYYTKQAGSCVIENTCYESGDRDVSDGQGTCQPSTNQTAWTPTTSSGVDATGEH